MCPFLLDHYTPFGLFFFKLIKPLEGKVPFSPSNSKIHTKIFYTTFIMCLQTFNFQYKLQSLLEYFLMILRVSSPERYNQERRNFSYKNTILILFNNNSIFHGFFLFPLLSSKFYITSLFPLCILISSLLHFHINLAFTSSGTKSVIIRAILLIRGYR